MEDSPLYNAGKGFFNYVKNKGTGLDASIMDGRDLKAERPWKVYQASVKTYHGRL